MQDVGSILNPLGHQGQIEGGLMQGVGIGELPHVPIAGAIANAVADAIGAPITQLPITAERVLEALEAARAPR